MSKSYQWVSLFRRNQKHVRWKVPGRQSGPYSSRRLVAIIFLSWNGKIWWLSLTHHVKWAPDISAPLKLIRLLSCRKSWLSLSRTVSPHKSTYTWETPRVDWAILGRKRCLLSIQLCAKSWPCSNRNRNMIDCNRKMRKDCRFRLLFTSMTRKRISRHRIKKPETKAKRTYRLSSVM